MREEELNLRLSMKSVLMYEKMTGKPFSLMENEEDIKIFMYCVFVCSTDLRITFPVFCNMLERKKFASKIEIEFKRIWGFEQQFPHKADEPQESGETVGKELKMTDYINTLVFDYGLSIDYCMNTMDLWELEALYEAAESHMHTDMEDKRLWAYIQMLPNFDKKHKNMTPEKFLPFPWEGENHKKKAEQGLENEKERAKTVLGMDLDVLLGNNIEEKPDNNEISNKS